MAYIDLASAGAASTSLPITIRDMTYHPSTYNQILILCTNGDRKYVTSGGGTSLKYYTTPAQFTGLTPGTTYGFRVEAIYLAGGRVVPIPENGSLTYFTTTGTPPPPPAPSTPSVFLTSVTGKTVLWRITAGSNTTRIYIDRSWSTVDNTALASGETWYFDYVGAAGQSYGIRVRGWNSGGGYGPWSEWRYGDIPPDIVVGSVGNVTITNTLTDRFTMTWNRATNAAAYLVYYRKQGTTAWTSATTTNYYYTPTGLAEETYYEFQVRGYNGSIYGAIATGTVRTQSARPTPLSWPTFVSGNSINLTAKNWNDMTSKINAWRVYKGLNTRTMAAAYTGNDITAEMYNDIVARLNELNVPGTVPQTVTRGNDITAAKINAIGNAIDSL